MRIHYSLVGGAALALAACSSDSQPPAGVGAGTNAGAGSGGTSGGGASPGNGGSGFIDFGDAGLGCRPTTCAELGWSCGYTVDACGNVTNCADEGLSCTDNQVCVGGIDGPTQCVAGGDTSCEVCGAVPECADAAGPTRLAGRVVTPGRDDQNTENQVGVPNAVVYISRSTDVAELPQVSAGIPTGGQSCERCEEQDLGPLLTGAITDTAGNFVLEGNIPVGVEFLLVVKAGKFRRAVTHTLPAQAACQTTELPTALPGNPTRLARSMSDGLAVNIPRVAISTGRIDAMECVFEKMGIAQAEFGNFGSDARLQLYRGGPASAAAEGARVNEETPADGQLYGSLARLQSYDMVVADCEGGAWDGRNTNDLFPERIAFGDNVREYVNRGGRLFASHLSMSWLHENGAEPYSAAAPIATGLGPAASWAINYTGAGNLDDDGTGVVSLVGDRPNASPRIQGFADWLVNEGVTTAPDYELPITDPRSLATGLGAASEEFVYREDGNQRVQQFSFNTPYAAPDEAVCGRVAYSGFHVAGVGGNEPFRNALFPEHCTSSEANDGNLTDQEKVLLYMLFDLGSCVGEDPLPPPCVPVTCGSAGARCGFAPDGCGDVIDCGACRPPA